MKRLLAGGIAGFLFFVCLFAFDHKSNKVEATAQPQPQPRSAMEHYNIDELALLTAACGKPTSDKLSNAAAYGGANAKRRTLVYGKDNAEFWFLKNSVDAPEWTLVGSFNAHGDDSVFSPSELHQRMPCTQKVAFHTSAADE
jgi:hypothetical protein